MSKQSVIFALGRADSLNIRRDSLLRWMLIAPFILAFGLIRLGLPWATAKFQANSGFDLTPYHILVFSYMITMAPMLYGVVVGFLLVDERDDGTLTALRVTPLSLDRYLMYRLGMPLLLSALLLPLILRVSGDSTLNTGQLILLAIASAPTAALITLSLALFAKNKVNGLALLKGMGIILMLPILAWFAPSKWAWLFGLFPTYWPMKLYWLFRADQSGWLVFLGGLLYAALLSALLVRRLNRAI
ncbi:MAG: hypothetical protein KAG66_03955 [Methylococcales bacterium]|nr:hypothetical protein [Methylococcales bacterium]